MEEQSTLLPVDESVDGRMNVDLILFGGGRVVKFLHVLAADVLLVIGEREVEVKGSFL